MGQHTHIHTHDGIHVVYRLKGTEEALKHWRRSLKVLKAVVGTCENYQRNSLGVGAI
jgi:hypothetical protein